MVNAAAQDQWRLLDVQGHDTRLAQLAHRQRTLGEHAEIEAITARIQVINDDLILAQAQASDVAREVKKAEGDVDVVRQRAARDQARLDSGQGSAKDLQAIQHELETLAARQAVLEDVELEVMERAEAADARVAELEAAVATLVQERAEVEKRRDVALASLADEVAAEQRARENSAAGVPAELIALYEKVREQNGGVGAARLYQRRCEGCRLEVNNIEMGRIRAAAENEVLRCEECSRILVRTPDSGL